MLDKICISFQQKHPMINTHEYWKLPLCTASSKPDLGLPSARTDSLNSHSHPSRRLW